MGLAQGGTITRSGSPLVVQGMRPSGLAVKGKVPYRYESPAIWELLSSSSLIGASGMSNPIDTTGANLLVVVTASWSGTTAPTDNYGNNWTLGIAANQGFNNGVAAIYYRLNPIVGSAHTFQVTGLAAGSFFALAFKGPIMAKDQSGTNYTPSSTNPIFPAGSLTPTVDNSLIIAGIAVSANIVSILPDFNLINPINFTAGVTVGAATAYLIQSSAVPIAPNWNLNVPAAYYAASVLLSFKPS